MEAIMLDNWWAQRRRSSAVAVTAAGVSTGDRRASSSKSEAR